MPDALQDFRIAQLKELGCNAYRTSHNPPTPELLDACDRLGMLVMDESRLLGSDSENMRKWDELIRRDRNHPSVALWSIANEEFTVQDTPQGGNVARTMQDFGQAPRPDAAGDLSRAAGRHVRRHQRRHRSARLELSSARDMDDYHAKHPDQPNVGTEQASTVGTRGIYENDAQRGYVAGL